MERFRLRVRNPLRKGHTWELHLFPEHSSGRLMEADGRILGSSTTPEAILWLKKFAEPFLLRAESPAPVSAEDFGPESEPRWLRHEDGMRLALAFSAVRYLILPKQRRMFVLGLKELPSEVVLYWFTLCFYGYSQAAGRAALRTLLTHEEPEMNNAPPLRKAIMNKDKNKYSAQKTLFTNGKSLREHSIPEAWAEDGQKVVRKDEAENAKETQLAKVVKPKKKASVKSTAYKKRGKKQ